MFHLPTHLAPTSEYHMRWLIGMPLLVAGAETDGCWGQIRAAAITASYGSSGFTVNCPAAPATAFFHKRESHLKGSAPAFLQTETTGRDPIQDFCLAGAPPSSGVTSEASVEMELDASYVIRGADFVASLDSTYSAPSAFKLDAREKRDDAVSWYATQSDADSGAAWTKFRMGSTGHLDSDLTGAVVRIALTTTTTTADKNAFGVELYGCRATESSLISFRFKSSKAAIIARFSKLSSFLTHLTEHVCLVTELSSTAALCARIVYAGLTEGTEDNPLAGSNSIAPAKLPYVEVAFRILPPGKPCADCRDAATVKSMLQTALSSSQSSQSQVMKAIDVWIEDSDPYTCASKTCPSGTLCVYGQCVTAAEIAAQAISTSDKDVEFTNSATLDQTLTLTPLSVIVGADTKTGVLSFASEAAQSGQVLTVTGAGSVTTATTVAPATTEDSMLSRFMVPIIVGSVVLAIIIGLIVWKVYQRKARAQQAAGSGQQISAATL